MKYLYSWLKEYYPGIAPLEKLPDQLVQIGHEVKSIDPQLLTDIIVAEIKSIEKHPNADRLSIVTLHDGNRDHRIVSGAPNIAEGQKVAFAPVHSVLPGGIIIRSAKIRDVVSEGMVCAEDELGLGRDHSTLFQLPGEAKLGTSIQNYVDRDAIIDLEITSNRGDVLSHFGLARDLSSIIDNQLLKPKFNTPILSNRQDDSIKLGPVIDDVTAIHFAAVQAEKPVVTPLWMTSRLQRLGYRSLNFATDITNYLYLAYGQPLHVYGRTGLSSPVILGVRRGRAEEKFLALNREHYTLSPQDLVITNNDIPIAMAGTIGSDQSKASDIETELVFESASFHPKTIGIMTRAHNISSESAHHYERGVDPTLTKFVLEEGLAIWQEYTNGKVNPSLSLNRTHEIKPVSALFTTGDVNKFLGTNLSDEKIMSILTALGCSIQINDENFSIIPPTWRLDLAYREDYYEEILRSLQIRDIPKLSLSTTAPRWKRSRYWRNEAIKDMLVQLGAYEIRTYSFISVQQKKLHHFDGDHPQLKIAPQDGKAFLRPSLLPGTLEAIATNPETPLLILFEIATIFLSKSETMHIIITTASNQSVDSENFWRNLFERLHLPVSSWMSRVNTVPDYVRDYYKIRKSEVAYLELPVESVPLTKIGDIPSVIIPDLDSISYTPLGKFQASRRDIALIVPSSESIEAIKQTIRQFHPLIIAVELFDTYTDPKLGHETVSYAFHVMYQSPDKTLASEEIMTIHKKLEEQIKEQFHAIIR